MSEEERIIKKRIREKQIVHLMIQLYCHKKHGKLKGELCCSCLELDEYAASRSDHCPFIKTKTFCSSCTVHCYRPDMRNRIREVMKFSGPRMLFYHPVLAVRHLFSTVCSRMKNKKNSVKI
ncbi:MAG: nitrous oxide-stimulated promoter family protein [Treponema sp.]|nr:nitrous oxide-stimulated promoter family protein [Treponema sp.]